MKSADLRLLLSTSGGRRLFLAVIFAGAFWSAIVVTNAILISEIIIKIIDRRPGVISFIAFLAALWIVRALFQSGFDHWTSIKAVSIKRQLRSNTSGKIDSYASASPAELSTLLTKGLNALDVYLGRFIPQMVFAAIAPVVVIAAIFTQDSLSGVIALVTLPLIPLFGALIGRYSADAVTKKWRTLGVLSSYFEDSLRGFVTLKIFGRSKSQADRIKTMGDVYADETMKVLRISFLSAFALELVATLSVAVIAVSVGLRLVSGTMDFKSALIVLVLAPEVYFPVRNAASLFHASQDGTESLRALEKVMSESSPTIQPTIEIDPQSISAISWDAHTFKDARVPGQHIERGEMLFVVGDSGVGKTTFANNLLGFTFDVPVEIHASIGTLTLNPHTKWQSLIGWIPQNPHLATGTVRDQFRLVDPSIADAEIVQLLVRAGLSISELPDGLQTSIGKGGESSHEASGGQVRRIALARALIRRPFLIVADEPTADLDDASARQVMHALRALQQDGSIVICISHDVAHMESEDSLCRISRVAR